ALAHVARGLLHHALFERGALVHAELEVKIGPVRAPLERGTENALERAVREPEALGEESLRLDDLHARDASRGPERTPPFAGATSRDRHSRTMFETEGGRPRERSSWPTGSGGNGAAQLAAQPRASSARAPGII